ncbi:MAG: aldose 1-epimerase family protein, partial [Anaerolineales bacterium]
DQLAGVRLVEYADGKARGLRAAEVWTGSGLRFTIWLDRGMDIGPAEFVGRPLAWLHPALGTPGQFEPEKFGWARTFGGGLMTTCGLTHFGQPEQDGAESLGLHGRISHIPAQNVRVTTEWQGDDYVIAVEGEVRQSVLFGENLLLTRRASTRLGATSFQIEDRVRNDGFRLTPHMLLYHCNFGFPVVSPDSELVVDDEQVRPRDDVAARGLATHTRFDQPDPNYAEQVFFHHPRPDASGYVTASIINRALNFGGFVRYRAAELPALAQWKMMGAGDYVCALEPATNHETPRSKLREQGRLKMLAPGEEVRYSLELGVVVP